MWRSSVGRCESIRLITALPGSLRSGIPLFQNKVRDLAHRALSSLSLRHPVRHPADGSRGVRHAEGDAGRLETGKVRSVVSRVSDRLEPEAMPSGEGLQILELVPRSDEEILHLEDLRVPPVEARTFAGDAGDREALLPKFVQRPAVEHAEPFHGLAPPRPVRRPVGEHAVDIENHRAQPSNARSKTWGGAPHGSPPEGPQRDARSAV